MFDLFYSSKETAASLKNHGNILMNGGRVSEAEHLYRRAIKLDSGFMPAHYNLGNALRAQGRFEEALAAYEAALKLAPGDYEIHMNIGATLIDLGRPADALKAFRRANEIMPTTAEPLVNMGLAYERLGHMEESPAMPGRTPKPDSSGPAHDGKNPDASLQTQNRFDAAIEHYRKALSISPNFAEAHNSMGFALQSQGKLDEATESFQRALSINPNFADAHYNLGNAYKELRRYEDAEASYRQALNINPDHVKTLNNYGGLLLECGHPDKAMACFQQVIRLDPKNAAASHLIASMTGAGAERAPNQYIAELFDGFANKFEANLADMKYDTPKNLVALVAEFAKPTAEKWDVLDLGCGTGLVGTVIAPHARQLVGVDLSAGMLAKARDKKLYQRLEKAELLAMMKGETASSYDVIIAADVFIYVGKLDGIMEEIKRLLRPGGVLAFSVEALGAPSSEEGATDSGKDYQLNSTGRYAHASSYLNKIIQASGFKKHHLTPSDLRLEQGEPVQGWLVLLEKVAQ